MNHICAGWLLEPCICMQLKVVLQINYSLLKHNSSQAEAGDANDDTNVPAGEPEPSTLLHACSNLVDADPVLQTHEVLDTSSRTSDPLYTASRTTSHDEKGCLSTSSNTVGCENLEKTLENSPSNDISSPLPEHSHPIRKRRFYHGWIDSDNDEDEYGDDDLVELTPAPLPEESTKLIQKAQDRVGLQA
ncbi:hypothetical protein FEM48_Zijuj02G0158100 [Ziziphus jujuba var. spinosa]|uniref:Uncharacterized protein n=1 Tax=Ziziphus jujuba var. spinosa TaxID=714518 RepID=A0A978VWK1_ZIZJJ|nr:hypothetical protein FEM48_Zijuj02G0158100 [Ziziphus jujuba var. spinosa]